MERDKFKQQCANQNGYSVIRILQEDVLNDKHNWFDKLLESIKSIIDEKIVKNIYLHNKGEYDTFIELFNA
jgi:very-short-patch-repair endonuclease